MGVHQLAFDQPDAQAVGIRSDLKVSQPGTLSIRKLPLGRGLGGAFNQVLKTVAPLLGQGVPALTKQWKGFTQ